LEKRYLTGWKRNIFSFMSFSAFELICPEDVFFV